MTSRPVFPPELARHVEAHWPEATPLGVPSHLLEEALSVAFQASMTSDEGRATRFRLLLTPPERLPESGVPNEGALRLRFDRSRPLHVDELRRLAQAVPFESALIGAHHDEAGADGLRIWGIAHSGPAWLAPTLGGRELVPNWTYDPIIHVTAPGQIAVRCAGMLVGAIERGILVDTMMDVFESEWLTTTFMADVVARQMLRRVLRLVRGARHGGLILLAGSGTDGLRLKYVLEQDEPARRFQTLLAQKGDLALARWEGAVFEWSRVIANLAAVDGAVVLDRRFGVLGFGAEVAGELATPSRVWRALDLDGRTRRPEDPESVGTRHRAAYRYVSTHADALAIVVSQDGGVSFVGNHDGDVIVWEHAMSP